MFLIFDTETTGLPRDYNAPVSDLTNWPRIVQIAWQLHDANGKLISNHNLIVKPEGFSIPYNAEKVHGISTERALREGHDLKEVLYKFLEDVNQATYLAGHNIEFDINVTGCELLRLGENNYLEEKKSLDTKDLSTDYCAIPGGKGGRFKWPTLTELYTKLFNEGFGDAHDAAYDVSATGKAFFELIRLNVIRVPEASASAIIYEAPVLESSNFKEQHEEKKTEVVPEIQTPSDHSIAEEILEFVHLHVHTQYSVLQSTSDIGGLIKTFERMGSRRFSACHCDDRSWQYDGRISICKRCSQTGGKTDHWL
jgi:DNA polymerase-3 subunit alpha